MVSDIDRRIAKLERLFAGEDAESVMPDAKTIRLLDEGARLKACEEITSVSEWIRDRVNGVAE